MKLPSISVLWQNFKNVCGRFPLQVIIALLATGIWCYLAGPDVPREQNNNLVKLLVICNLGLTLLLALDTYSESRGLGTKPKWLLRIIALGFLTGLYFLLDPHKYLIDVFRIALLAFAFHLLVAFSPFIRRGNLNGFWQYNKSLFLRFLTSAFYATVLFAGLAVALMAIDGLFNAEIKYYSYMRLFAVVSAGFTTIFFLAGVPANFPELDQEESYPKGLKIFTQYVLIPLMTIYLAILLVYEAKIAINWELPKGLVSTLILGYAVFGILSLLLVYPIKEKEENGWIKLFSRFFYLMMIPLVILLILAVVKRVGNYGITESRYILIILAAWLTGITIYFLGSNKQNIKVIPISLFVLALLATYGPQSAFSVSKASQTARLKKLMHEKDKKKKSEVSEVVRYLVDRHGLTSLQGFTSANLQAIEQKIDANAKQKRRYDYEIRSEKLDTAFALLKVDKKNYGSDNGVSFNFNGENGKLVDIKGYDAVVDIDNYGTMSLTFESKSLSIENKKTQSTANYTEQLVVSLEGQQPVVFKVAELAKSLYSQRHTFKETNSRNFSVPSQLLQITQQSTAYTFTFVATSLNGYYQNDDDDFNWLNFEGYLLIKKN